MNKKSPSCNEKVVKVTRKDLPLSCPRPDQVIWNAHPREYLPIEDSKREVCPYCRTVYVLVEESDD